MPTRTLTSSTPVELRDRAWKKNVKHAEWRIEEGHVAYSVRGKDQFRLPIGDEAGHVHSATLVRGLLLAQRGPLIVDHYVFLDVNREVVSPAIRRARPRSEPASAWWPINDIQELLKPAGVPLTLDTAHSMADLESRFPQILTAN